MYDLQIIRDLAKDSGFNYTENEPLKKHTSFKIGGNAEIFVEVFSVDQLRAVLDACKENNIPLFVIGKGSNLLISDNGMKGVVLSLEGEFKEISIKENKVISGAGVSLSRLCNFALGNALSGLEFGFGIPGTVGGAAYMNAGAYDGEMKNVIESVTHITRDGRIETLTAEELDLSYRHSIFHEQRDWVILSAEFELKEGDQAAINAKMEELMGRRIEKQPLDYPSCGSTFKRPVGAYASKLIDDCGLKGLAVGGAQVSEKHCGFVINRGGATSNDILCLCNKVKQIVLEKTGFELELEVELLK